MTVLMAVLLNDQVEFIKEHLTVADLWGQLAEELCEAAQSCLKMQRLESKLNKPRKTRQECLASVVEEFTDIEIVSAVLEEVLHDSLPDVGCANLTEMKLNRWVNKIKEELAKDENLESEN